MSIEQYNQGKIAGPLKEKVISTINRLGGSIEMISTVSEILESYLPTQSEENPECPNCQASMIQYTHRCDHLDVHLVLEMARKVREKRNAGLDFTDANKIYVQEIGNLTYAEKSRTTWCSKLGLIAKLLNDDGSQEGGIWVITRRGFSALRNEPFSRSVTTFRNEIVAYHNDMTTFSEILGENQRGKVDKASYGYDPVQWFEFGDIMEGKLF